MQEQLLEFRHNLSRQWGWIALSGAASVIFGILALMWPLATIWALAIMWGAFALADGIFSLMAAWRMHKRGVRWWPYLAFGLVGIAAGIVTLLWPAVTAIALVYLIAFWALFGGISQIVAAFRLRKEIEGEWFLGLSGVFGVIFGLMVLFRPLPEGVVVIALLVGFFAMVRGILYLLLAFRVRKSA